MSLLLDIYNFFMDWYPLLFDRLLEKNPIPRVFEVVGITALFTLVACFVALPVIYFLLVPAFARLWNFCVVETLYEIIYILVYKNPMKRPSVTAVKFLGYLQKCTDSIRMYLDNDPSNAVNTDIGKTISYRAFKNKKSKAGVRDILIILSTLFIILFCVCTILYELTYKNQASQEEQGYNTATKDEIYTGDDNSESDDLGYAVLKLNSKGIKGSKIRALPSSLDSDVLEVVSGDIDLIYLGDTKFDSSENEWHNVRTPSGVEGWISGVLVELVDSVGGEQ